VFFAIDGLSLLYVFFGAALAVAAAAAIPLAKLYMTQPIAVIGKNK
jgi:hypothetical protein